MKIKNNYSGLLVMLGVAVFMLLAVFFIMLPTIEVSAGPNKCPDDHAGCVWVQKIKQPWQCMWKPPNYNRKVWQAILPEGYCPDDEPKPTETEEPPEPTATDKPKPTATDRPPDPTATDRPPDPTATDRPQNPTATERPTETEPPDSTGEPRIVVTPTPTATFSMLPVEQRCDFCLLMERIALALERIALAQEQQVDVQSAIATSISK